MPSRTKTAKGKVRLKSDRIKPSSARETSFRFATFVSASQTPAKKERQRDEKAGRPAGEGVLARFTGLNRGLFYMLTRRKP